MTDKCAPHEVAAEEAPRGTINMTVMADEKWRYKEWCARHRRSQVDAFREAFRLLQERYGD